MNRRNFLMTQPALALAIGMGGASQPALAAQLRQLARTHNLQEEADRLPRFLDTEETAT